MAFYFSLPQTLIRYFASDISKNEHDLIFVPESPYSNTTRNNNENLNISRKILYILNPNTQLQVWDHKNPPHLISTDGIGNELLRGIPTYQWELQAEVQYIIHHSALGYEGINLNIITKPNYLYRAIKRMNKYYNRIRFEFFFMYCGKDNTKLNLTVRPWERIQVINHSQLIDICRKLTKLIEPINKNNFKNSNQNLLLLGAGDFTKVIKYIENRERLSKMNIYIKNHPQQKSHLVDFKKLNNTFFIENKSLPVEIYIELLKPAAVIGPQSSLNWFCEMPYLKYYPDDWGVKTEAELIDKYRSRISKINHTSLFGYNLFT
jgi:hypothetical protein